ncbi:MAG TPA: DUF6491 family protein [Steroidobacteraceae bacterium]
MKTLILSLPLLALAACVSSGPQSQLGKKEPQRIKMSRTSDCVFHSTISGFEALDDRYVVLFSMGRRKAYLAEIAGGCFNMKTQQALAAVDGDGNGQICGFGRDSIAYRNLGMVEDCRIMGLEELNDERRLELGIGVPEKKPRKEKEEKKEDESK